MSVDTKTSENPRSRRIIGIGVGALAVAALLELPGQLGHSLPNVVTAYGFYVALGVFWSAMLVSIILTLRDITRRQ